MYLITFFLITVHIIASTFAFVHWPIVPRTPLNQQHWNNCLRWSTSHGFRFWWQWELLMRIGAFLHWYLIWLRRLGAVLLLSDQFGLLMVVVIVIDSSLAEFNYIQKQHKIYHKWLISVGHRVCKGSYGKLRSLPLFHRESCQELSCVCVQVCLILMSVALFLGPNFFTGIFREGKGKCCGFH